MQHDMAGDTPLQGGTCRRCGTCCLKGGPALHLADRERIESGRIPLNALVTIRQGEPVYDNVLGRLAAAPTDIIKIAAAGDRDRACRFFAQDHCACTIYDDRPLECRALACRDTAALEAIYCHERITRRDLIGAVPALWELVRDHQARCGYERVAELADRLKVDWRDSTAEDLLYLIRYDLGLRQGVCEHAPRNSAILHFLFGLPLSETIRRYGLRVVPGGRLLAG